MKKINLLLLAGILIAVRPAVCAELPVEARQALRLAATDIQSTLASAGSIPKNQPIAILPIRGDDSGYVMGILKTALTGAGLQCVEGYIASVAQDQESKTTLSPMRAASSSWTFDEAHC